MEQYIESFKKNLETLQKNRVKIEKDQLVEIDKYNKLRNILKEYQWELGVFPVYFRYAKEDFLLSAICHDTFNEATKNQIILTNQSVTFDKEMQTLLICCVLDMLNKAFDLGKNKDTEN